MASNHRLIMILQQTKILTNRYQPEYFSMALDNRGFPHLAWMEQKNGHYDLVYKFWNGICWETLESEVLYRSDDEISYANLIVSNGEILITFIKKSYNNSIIGFIKIDQVVKEIIEYQTDGFVEWVSLIQDKTEKERPYIISYEDSSFKIYQLTDENLILQGSKNYSVEDPNSIRATTTKDNFVIAINNSSNIEFNFFNYDSNSWANTSFLTLSSSTTSGTIIDFAIDGLNNSSQSGFTWIENNNGEKIHYLTSDDAGTETILDSDPIYQTNSSLTPPEGFTVGGFATLGLSMETDLNPHIIALGAQNTKFSYTTEWEQEVLGVPTKSESTVFIFNSFNVATIGFGQIYFFELTDDPIDVQETPLSLLNAKEFITSTFAQGALDVNELSAIDNYDNEVGDLLRDALLPLIVVASNEHPGFASSSSTSSDSTQSTSSDSSQSDSSQSDSSDSSTSSEGYSSDSSTSSEGYSSDSSSSNSSSSSTENVHHEYLPCDLFTESISSESESSSSEGYSESSSSSSSTSNSSSSSTENVHFKYENCDLFTESISSESSSSEGYSESSSSEMYSESSSSEGYSESSSSEGYSESSSSSSEGYSESSSSSEMYSESSSSEGYSESSSEGYSESSSESSRGYTSSSSDSSESMGNFSSSDSSDSSQSDSSESFNNVSSSSESEANESSSTSEECYYGNYTKRCWYAFNQSTLVWELSGSDNQRTNACDLAFKCGADNEVYQIHQFATLEQRNNFNCPDNPIGEVPENCYSESSSSSVDITHRFLDCATGLVEVAKFDVEELPSDDYCWVHDGTDYIKSYKDGVSIELATSPVPCVIYMPTTPANCAAVNGTAFGDDFTGTNGDSLDACKWSRVKSQGLAEIQSNKLQISVPGTGTDFEKWENEYPLTGDFDIQVDVDWTGLDLTLGSGQFVQAVLEVSGFHAVVVGKFAPNATWPSGGGTAYDFQASPSTSAVGATQSAGTSDTLRLKRVGTAMTGYFNAVSYAFSETSSGTVTATLQVLCIGSIACDADFDNYTIS